MSGRRRVAEFSGNRKEGLLARWTHWDEAAVKAQVNVALTLESQLWSCLRD
jgi:hypothetical protein